MLQYSRGVAIKSWVIGVHDVQEVLVVEDENGEVVKEHLKDVEV